MPKILVIDDDENILNLVSTTLKNAGHIVYTASDGEEGIEKVIETEPDLIITDVEMPKKMVMNW